MWDLDSDDDSRVIYPGVTNTVPEFKLSEDSRRVIKGILESKTANTRGILNIDELGDCLDAFGFTFDDEDVDFLKKHFDDNGDGELEIEELMNNIDVLNWHSLYGKRLMREFKKIDFDRDGVIRYPEMLKVLTTRGPNPLSPKDARRLLDQLARKFDANFDGKFSYAEFVKIYMSDMLPYHKAIVDNVLSSSDEEPSPYAAGSQRRETKKKKSVQKKKPTDINGSARGAVLQTTASAAPSAGTTTSTYSRAGATGAPPQSARRRPAPPTQTQDPDYSREGSSRPRSVWDRLSRSKTPAQKRGTYH